MSAGTSLSDASARDVTLTTRVTKQERDDVAAWAATAGCDVSAYVRGAVFGRVRRSKEQATADGERGRLRGRAERQPEVTRLRAQLAETTRAAQQEQARLQAAIAALKAEVNEAARTAAHFRNRAFAADRQRLIYEDVDAFLRAVHGVLEGVDGAALDCASRWARLRSRDRDRANGGAVTLMQNAVQQSTLPSLEQSDDEITAHLGRLNRLLTQSKWLFDTLGDDDDYIVSVYVELRRRRLSAALKDRETDVAKIVEAMMDRRRHGRAPADPVPSDGFTAGGRGWRVTDRRAR
jgi:hypothetical protein